MIMQNPFTTTFSKAPEHTYITTEKTAEILENLSYEVPSESVYKITGVRGSGKTVILAKIEEELRNDASWIVIDINPSRDILLQIAAKLQNEGYKKTKYKSNSINLSATVLGNGGGVGYSSEKSDSIFDIGIEIEEMIVKVSEKGKKIFVGIDEVSKSKEMIEFSLEFNKWIRAQYPVFLVCTGLYENIQELCNVKNITFFRRATTIKTEPLSIVRMAEMYKSKLEISHSDAVKMANLTKGYAYAFQELGILYFKKKPSDTLDDLLPDLKTELFAYSYEKIWEEMTNEDKFLIKCLKDKDEYKREEILKIMGEKSGNYSVYRDRLLKRGVLLSRQSYISFALPFFKEYISDYCSF